MSISQNQELVLTGTADDFSPNHPGLEAKAPLWLMVLLSAITAVIFIWVMLIVAYPALAGAL